MVSDAVPAGWLLAVDFGTSNTAAAHINDATGEIQTLALSHSGNLIASSVFVAAPTQIDVGEAAVNKAATDPAQFVAAPKRALSAGRSTFQLGEWDIPAHTVVAAVLRAVLVRAQAQHRGRPPAGLVLTHPENWSPHQVRTLTDAANEVGYPADLVTLVSEPRAAAHHYSRTAAPRPGERVAVFDFGGGTLDVAVLTAGPDGGFQVIAGQGDNALGGRDFDAAIRQWVHQELAEEQPELSEALRQAPAADLARLELSIRAAKEVLSEAPQASIEVVVGGQAAVLRLTAPDFERLIAAHVERAAELTRATLAAAGPEPVRALYLTGGSSRIPLVQRRIQTLGPVATLDDPKAVVSKGALAFAAARSAAPRHTPTAARPARAKRPVVPIAVGAAAVAAALVVATFVLVNRGKQAERGPDPVAASPAANPQAAQRSSTTASTSTPYVYDPSANKVQAVVPGWHGIRSSKYGVAWDLPPGGDWRTTPGSVGGYETKAAKLFIFDTTVYAPSPCPGVVGGNRGVVGVLGIDDLPVEQGAANAVRLWVQAATTARDAAVAAPVLPAMPVTPIQIADGLIPAMTATATYTPLPGDRCPAPSMKVTTAAFKQGTKTVILVMEFAEGVPGALPDEQARQILTSLRPVK